MWSIRVREHNGGGDVEGLASARGFYWLRLHLIDVVLPVPAGVLLCRFVFGSRLFSVVAGLFSF